MNEYVILKNIGFYMHKKGQGKVIKKINSKAVT